MYSAPGDLRRYHQTIPLLAFTDYCTLIICVHVHKYVYAVLTYIFTITMLKLIKASHTSLDLKVLAINVHIILYRDVPNHNVIYTYVCTCICRQNLV